MSDLSEKSGEPFGELSDTLAELLAANHHDVLPVSTNFPIKPRTLVTDNQDPYDLSKILSEQDFVPPQVQSEHFVQLGNLDCTDLFIPTTPAFEQGQTPWPLQSLSASHRFVADDQDPLSSCVLSSEDERKQSLAWNVQRSEPPLSVMPKLRIPHVQQTIYQLHSAFAPSELICNKHGCNGRSFSSMDNYRRHLREKKLGLRIICLFCNTCFTRKSNLKQHLSLSRCKAVQELLYQN